MAMPAPGGPTALRIILGGQLQALREKAGLSHEQAAYEVHASAWTIRQMEKADRPPPVHRPRGPGPDPGTRRDPRVHRGREEMPRRRPAQLATTAFAARSATRAGVEGRDQRRAPAR